MEMLLLMTIIAAFSMFNTTAAQTTHQVGDSLGWLLPPGGDADYASWTSTKTFTVGDILVFNYVSDTHSVAEVSKDEFGRCNTANPISISKTGPTSITLSSAGEHFYVCAFPGHCGLGQKLAINVSTSSSTSPVPQPSSPATPLLHVPEPTPLAPPLSLSSSFVEVSTQSPTFGGSRVYDVGNGTWTVPQTGPSEYQTWTSAKRFKVGDVLEFNFANGTHDVAEVTKASFDSCDVSSPLFRVATSPARTTLRTSGEHYYICTFPSHCSLGQKLAINVTLGGSAPSPASPSATSPPSSIAIPPSESPTSAPGNSAPSSLAVTALPLTLLSIALAYFY